MERKNGRSESEVALDWATLAQPGGRWSSSASPNHFMTLIGHLSHHFHWHKVDLVKNKIQTIQMSSPTILSRVPVLSLPNNVSSALALPEGNPEAGECFGVNSLTGEFIGGSVDTPVVPVLLTCKNLHQPSRAVKKGSKKM